MSFVSKADGRDTRWAEHRVERRRELVEATLRAIRRHGARLGMEDIAAEAATSKTVIYRHFGDRVGLYLAVVEKVAENILADLHTSVTWERPDDLARLVSDMATSYLGLVERDPEIYRFVMNRPLVDRPIDDDPVTGLTNRIGDQVSAVLRGHGYDADTADSLGHGLVGFVRAVSAQWVAAGMRRPRSQVVTDLTDFFRPVFAAAAPAAVLSR